MHIADGTYHIVTKIHACKRDRVDAHIEQGSSAEFGLEESLHLVYLIAECGGEHFGFSYGTTIHDFLYLARHGHIASPDGFCDEDAPLLGKCQEFSGLTCIGRKSFLHQARLAMLYRQTGVGIVMGMRGGHIDDIHLRVIDQFFIRAIGFLYVVLFGKGNCFIKRTGCHGIAFTSFWFAGQGLSHLSSNLSCSKYSQSHS